MKIIAMIGCIVLVAVLSVEMTKTYVVLRDNGHRLYAVPSEEASVAVVKVLEETTNLDPYGTMGFGKSHQTVMQDGYTVIHYLEGGACPQELTGSGMSHIVDDPRRAAEKAARVLKRRKFEAVLEDGGLTMGIAPNLLVLVETDATCGWPIVYRKHRDYLPKPVWHKVRG